MMKMISHSPHHTVHAVRALLLLLVTVLMTSCNDFLDITPTGKVIAKTG